MIKEIRKGLGTRMKKGLCLSRWRRSRSPRLITLKGKQILEDCDAVVYDHLASTAGLSWVPPPVVSSMAGKQAGHHFMKQDQINELLIAGLRRLKSSPFKGGDSFVFGRGSEEILALREHGISWEVVPGITSCVAVPELAGIPVTHRNVSPQLSCDHQSHPKGAQSEKELASYGACGRNPGISYGTEQPEYHFSRPDKRRKTSKYTDSSDEDGSLNSQRVIRGTLKTIYEQTVKAEIKTPAIIVVGGNSCF